MATVEQEVARKRHRLKEIEAEYIRIRDYLKSPEWQAERDKKLTQVGQIVGHYLAKGGDAAFAIGRIAQVMIDVQQVSDVIVEFESLKSELERYAERYE